MTETYELFTVPTGTKIDVIETDDPLVKRYEFTLPDGAFKTLELGPHGPVVTETEFSDKFTISVGVTPVEPGGGLNSDDADTKNPPVGAG